jgi:hypothetical protein
MAHSRIRLDELLTPPSPSVKNITTTTTTHTTSTTTNTDTDATSGPALGRVTFLKLPLTDQKSPTVKAYANEVINAVRELVKLNPVAQEHIHEWYVGIGVIACLCGLVYAGMLACCMILPPSLLLHPPRPPLLFSSLYCLQGLSHGLQ